MCISFLFHPKFLFIMCIPLQRSSFHVKIKSCLYALLWDTPGHFHDKTGKELVLVLLYLYLGESARPHGAEAHRHHRYHLVRRHRGSGADRPEAGALLPDCLPQGHDRLALRNLHQRRAQRALRHGLRARRARRYGNRSLSLFQKEAALH